MTEGKAHAFQVGQHVVAFGNDPLGPCHDAPALLGEALEAVTALHDDDAQILLQTPDRDGQCRLADMAARGGPPEMPFGGQRQEVVKVLQKHVTCHR